MRVWVVLVVVLAGLSHGSSARACSCMRLTPSEGLTSSYAVFTGEVTEIRENQATPFGGLEVTLKVKKLWKGDPKPAIKVHTAGSSAACGYPFQKGQVYLVYAVRDEADPMRVSLCSRTAQVDQAKEDLDFLGKPLHSFDGRRSGCSVRPAGSRPANLAMSWLLALGLAASAQRVASVRA